MASEVPKAILWHEKKNIGEKFAKSLLWLQKRDVYDDIIEQSATRFV
jgi:hypothetical protein